MRHEIRRVVTGHDDSGKAVVVSDGGSPTVKVRKASGGLVSSLLWATDESPADVSGSTDRALRDIGTAPPDCGSVFRVVDFPPTDEAGIDNEAVLREMGLGPGKGNAAPEHKPAPPSASHPLMHRTRSIDYAIVISGEIDMLLDDGEVHLKAGDVLVQQATNHAWVNRGKEWCRIAFILIDAAAPAQWGNAAGDHG